jgi:hypothetical protein
MHCNDLTPAPHSHPLTLFSLTLSPSPSPPSRLLCMAMVPPPHHPDLPSAHPFMALAMNTHTRRCLLYWFLALHGAGWISELAQLVQPPIKSLPQKARFVEILGKNIFFPSALATRVQSCFQGFSIVATNLPTCDVALSLSQCPPTASSTHRLASQIAPSPHHHSLTHPPTQRHATTTLLQSTPCKCSSTIRTRHRHGQRLIGIGFDVAPIPHRQGGQTMENRPVEATRD